MAKRRNKRQDAIRGIIRDKSIRTQRALVDELESIGFACTQATVSRDISDMGLRKLPGGAYILTEDLQLQAIVSEHVTEVSHAGNLVVIRAVSGAAPKVADALDAAGLPGMLGVVADGNTILAVASSEEEGTQLEALVNKLRNAR